ncbi:uncharacterized protein LOC124286506 [Haliotis rubra]|uniref:uncharacterized protein LOC124286506 n=1 Tax=Haliotis rubra TaxID=36100 RepID=UPI001EE5ED88|nr:uncharacterized protein LOC124286506 [Haliotis rubra]
MSLNCSNAFLFVTNGYVRPVNPYGFINETLTLTCNVTKDSLAGNISGGLFFKLTFLKKVKVLPMHFVTQISDRAIQLDYPLTSRRDQGQYTCKLNTTDVFIGEQRVHVEYRPRKVEKLDCRVFDWRNMTCRWDLGVDYINRDMVTSQLFWEIKGGANRCPHSRATTCIWKETEEGNRVDFFKPHQNYLMQVNVSVHRKEPKKSLLDTAASEVFSINPRNLVEPAPVQSVTVGNRTSTCLSLRWNHEQYMWGMMYTVHVHQKQGSVLKVTLQTHQ